MLVTGVLAIVLALDFGALVWPYCLAEIGLYAVLAAIVLAMALDARDRWQKLRERADTAAADDTAADEDEAPEVSAVRARDGNEPGEPPPAA